MQVSSLFRDPQILRNSWGQIKSEDIRTNDIQRMTQILVDACISNGFIGISPQNLIFTDPMPSLAIAPAWKGKEVDYDNMAIIFNPRIISQSWNTLSKYEWCGWLQLFEWTDHGDDKSLLLVRKTRPKRIKVTWLDKNGEPITTRFEWLQRYCMHHEVDHTNGIVITDKVKDPDLQIFRKEGGNNYFIDFSIQHKAWKRIDEMLKGQWEILDEHLQQLVWIGVKIRQSLVDEGIFQLEDIDWFHWIGKKTGSKNEKIHFENLSVPWPDGTYIKVDVSDEVQKWLER